MILIISSPDDISTNDVIDWLRHYQINFLRITEETKVSIIEVKINNDISDALLKINDKNYWISDFISIWFRRSWLFYESNILDVNLKGLKELENQINRQLIEENYYLGNFVDKLLKQKMLNCKEDNILNKLSVLETAKNIGISIPNTIITSDKAQLLNFVRNIKNKIITKNFSPGLFVKFKNHSIGSYTKLVSIQMIEELPDKFQTMLFQVCIDKLFEVRVFYLNGEFFSSAILSQNDEKTKLDFRNYNWEKRNRTPPFELPKDLKIKLKILMDKLDLNSGSLDLLVTIDAELIFLEVNPIGQFSQVSLPCNYNLEKKIAISLMNNYHERKN